jgi:hypothetical protein
LKGAIVNATSKVRTAAMILSLKTVNMGDTAFNKKKNSFHLLRQSEIQYVLFSNLHIQVKK